MGRVEWSKYNQNTYKTLNNKKEIEMETQDRQVGDTENGERSDGGITKKNTIMKSITLYANQKQNIKTKGNNFSWIHQKYKVLFIINYYH